MTHHTTHIQKNRPARATMLLLTGIACFAIAIPAACSNHHEEAAPEQGDRASQVNMEAQGLHVVHNAELRTIMNKLHALHLSQISDEIEITGELQRDICDVATIAESLAADAQLMPLLLKDSTMTPESRRMLVSMTSRLHLEAEELADAANRGDLPAVRNNLQTMLDTCTACHHQFRAPALAFAGYSHR